MAADTTISIIIVTWNGLDLLKTYLPSVYKNLDDQSEIIIADNASEDDTRAWVEANMPECKIVTHSDNFGYCGGNNKAVDAADGDILLFLNNDVRVSPNWLKPIRQRFTDKSVGAAQPTLLSQTEPQKYEYAGAAGGYVDYLGFPFCKGRIFDHVENFQTSYQEPSSIFWASGAALAVRKNLFQKLGGFDERFEFHMEEIDLCWRIQRAGHHIVHEPSSHVYHLGGGSLPTGSPRKIYYNFRNTLLMLHKNMVKNELDSIRSKKIMLDYIAALKFIADRNLKGFKAVLQAHRDAEKMIKMYDLTSEDSKLPKIPVRELRGVYHRSIVREFYLRGKKEFRDLEQCAFTHHL